MTEHRQQATRSALRGDGPRPSRRSVLRIVATTAALPLAVLGAGRGIGALRGEPEPHVWQGEALGALASVTIYDGDPRRAQSALARVQAELRRLSGSFDLHDPASEIAQLNATGRLARPTADMRHVLQAALTMAETSRGAFDPTIQPLWRARFDGADAATLAQARALIGWDGVSMGGGGIALARPGMALTLNGIAQGHAADRLALILHEAGLHEALIDAGEVSALGRGPDGQGHKVALMDAQDPRRIAPGPGLRLADSALAVSGGYGLRLADGGHHILDPHSGHSAGTLREVVVSHPSAMLADALSTALYVAGPASAAGLLGAYRGASARLTLNDGQVLRFGSGATTGA